MPEWKIYSVLSSTCDVADMHTLIARCSSRVRRTCSQRCVEIFPTATARICTRKNLLQRNRKAAWRICISRSVSRRGQIEVDARITLHDGGLGNLLGRSPAMKQVFALIQRVAPTEATV